jgi:hypothetical protein
MNKKESSAAGICNRTSTSVVRALSIHPEAAGRLILAKPVATQAGHPPQRIFFNAHDSVRNGLTLNGISVNGSVVHPLDGLLLDAGSNTCKRDLT